MELLAKLFTPGSQVVEYEARITSAVHTAGLPVPTVGDVIEIEGRIGIIFERLEGVTIWPRPLRRSRAPRVDGGDGCSPPA